MGPQPEPSLLPLQEWMVKCDSDAIPSPFVTLYTECMSTLSIGCSDRCSRMVVGGQQICCTLKLCCAFCSYTRFNVDEERLFTSIRRFTIIIIT